MGLSLPTILPEELQRLPSPQLVIFRDRLLSNLDSMLKLAKSPARLRPHCKTHKMHRIIRLWVERGVLKHKAATIAECEMCASAGATDVLYAYNPVGPNIDRLVALAGAYPQCRFRATTDHERPLRQLSAAAAAAGVTIGVMLDVNVGMDRTGMTPETPGAAALYDLVRQLPGLEPSGFQVYDGHQRQGDLMQRRVAVAEQWPRVLKLRAEAEALGSTVPAFACGGTPTFPCYASMSDPAIETCPGTSVLSDSGYGNAFPDLPFAPAAALVTRVVSRPAPNRMTLDLGNKAVAADPPKGARVLIPELPDAVQDIHSEEHLVLVTAEAEKYQPGDVLLAIPVHVCPTSALYDRAVIIDGGRIVDFWEVTSRNRRIVF
ncbi:MAG: D-TA family PLP-dependent enzyme [Planctomyces sp.]|jgi:D-serine deaminase-like pyridoxal phosphate-dependent protein|uniref:Threonine aldolase n=1 Tax=Planctomyces bekefii TaxID=1653850 RepID=A0A5C6M337_9PLAN|nr:D-TA family PLP-dependent enzyme [Planctomyces sp.]TWW09028.1 threonine aldolase [Planctomyces bekefii]GDX90497.1 threonine aldolase [Planctomycetia bacterium]